MIEITRVNKDFDSKISIKKLRKFLLKNFDLLDKLNISI